MSYGNLTKTLIFAEKCALIFPPFCVPNPPSLLVYHTNSQKLSDVKARTEIALDLYIVVLMSREFQTQIM